MDNPFAALPSPPTPSSPPEEQLRYLEGVVEAFRSAGNARIKPLQKQLTLALERLHRGAGRGEDRDVVAMQLADDIAELRVQTFELLLVVVNQVRATLRVKLQRGLAPPERLDVTALNKGLTLYAEGVRQLVVAFKKGDEHAVQSASRALDEASALMKTSGEALSELPPS